MKKVLIVISVFLLFFVSKGFSSTIYFGEDLNWYNTGVSTNSDTARTSFFAQLNGVGTEDFESFTYGQTAPLIVDFGAAGTATLGGVGAINTGSGNGRKAYSGTAFWETNTGSFVITFSESIAAFGFYGIDFGDFSGQISVNTINGTTHTYDVGHTQSSSADGALLYWGIIDTVDTFTSISITNTGSSSDWFGFDDFSIGTVEQVSSAPEPATFLLFGLGILGIAGVSRKKTA